MAEASRKGPLQVNQAEIASTTKQLFSRWKPTRRPDASIRGGHREAGGQDGQATLPGQFRFVLSVAGASA